MTVDSLLQVLLKRWLNNFPSRMVVFPNAKINLGLWVVERRKDGYHNLESCFFPIPWKDILEFIESDQLVLTQSGLPIPGSLEDNLLLKAYHLLNDQFDLPPLHMHLHKQIPMGAGLGGGSSDAAFLLRALNDFYDLKIGTSELQNIAKSIGADCPFFIENTEKMVFGIGDIFEPISIDLSSKWISLIYPGIHISTPEAYQSLNPSPRRNTIRSLINKPVNEWKGQLSNDFEAYALKKAPQLKNLKDQLYLQGAEYVSMTGSGSCFYAISSQPLNLNFSKKGMTFSLQL